VAKRVVFIGGKAAPGYARAKTIIQLINNVARVINADPDTNDVLKLVFLRNYDVTLTEKLLPAADLCQQISTAGKEASGTSNMKFQLNGVPIVGTIDGANVEILDRVGEDAFFRFGHTVEELQELRHSYNPAQLVEEQPTLRRVLRLIESGTFHPPGDEAGGQAFEDLARDLRERDEYFLVADFESYCATQARVAQLHGADPLKWARLMLRNIACGGFFSSDRTIRDYNKDIWHLPTNIVPRVRLEQATF